MITPLEKSKELNEMFWMTNPIHNTDIGEKDYTNSIKCTLICVEEMIKVTGAKYWYDVKQETNNFYNIK